MRVRMLLGALCLCVGFGASHAQEVGLGGMGQPTYSVPIAVPPGISGMTPELSIQYTGSSVNGPLGVGWTLTGISQITRCGSTVQTDGISRAVAFTAEDRLCIDGQRLIATNSSGIPVGSTRDAEGCAGSSLATSCREYRVERNTFARIRAYGRASATVGTSGTTMTGGSVADGPMYFKVWTKAGQIFEYGLPPSMSDDDPKALVSAQGKAAAAVWSVARVSDTLGNHMKFYYAQEEYAWGSGVSATAPDVGLDWRIIKIVYTGFDNGDTSRGGKNSVVFTYEARPAPLAASDTYDRAETYQAGSKNINLRRLASVQTRVLGVDAATRDSRALPVLTLNLSYEQSPVTGRSRLTALQSCAGDYNSTRCLPQHDFVYSNDGEAEIRADSNFNLSGTGLMDKEGDYGVMVGDFNGDGLQDLMRWDAGPSGGTKNIMYRSKGDGGFTQLAIGSGAGQFNRSGDLFFSKDGCILSMASDVNSDGLTDIIRFNGRLKTDGRACAEQAGIQRIFYNTGDFKFEPRTITDSAAANTEIKLAVETSKTLYPGGECNDIVPPGGEPLEGDTCQSGWTAGQKFYLLDTNDDGRLDIVRTQLPFRSATGKIPTPPITTVCPSGNCTQVYLATSEDGKFRRIVTTLSVTNESLYSSPEDSPFKWIESIHDYDGDGLPDIINAGKSGLGFYRAGNWRSLGNGDFSYVAGARSCDHLIDFNGDGRADCLNNSSFVQGEKNQLLTATGTSYTFNGQSNASGLSLQSEKGATVGNGFGSIFVDLNSDGKTDIIRWHDDKELNRLYISAGNGDFFARETPNFSSIFFKSLDGTYDTVIADFTGKGSGDLLRLSVNAAGATSGAAQNFLFAKPSHWPDRLVKVTSPERIVTDIKFKSLVASPDVYVSDRGTPKKAAYPLTDVSLAIPVVYEIVQDSGTTGGRLVTKYWYQGLKSALDGRGLLGFRVQREQGSAPNGDPMTTSTEFLFEPGYEGMAKRTEMKFVELGDPSGTTDPPGTTFDNAPFNSRTINFYCEPSSPLPPADASEAKPCPIPATTKVRAPYLRESREYANDLDGAELPQIVTTNTFNTWGDPTETTVRTTGTIDGSDGTKAYTSTTVNVYNAADISGDRWVLGRLKETTVTNTVPNFNLTPVPGTNTNATLTDGAQIGAATTPPKPPSKALPARAESPRPVRKP